MSLALRDTMDEKVAEEVTPTGTEQVNVVIPRETRQEKTSKEDRRPCCVKVLTVLVILLLMTIAALIVVYFVVLKDDDDDDADKKEGICTSRGCITTAGIIAQKMDPSVDPCQNFADFACGGFYRETKLPRTEKWIGAFREANDDNFELVRDIIEEKKSPDDPEYLAKIKDCYWSCMNEETVGLEHFLNTSFASMWPTLNPNWDPATFDFNKTMVEYALHDITPFVSIKVDPNSLNSSQHIIYCSLPTRLIVAMVHLLGPRNSSVMLAVHRYITDIAVEVGADPEVAREDTDQYIDFLIRIAMASVESSKAAHLAYLSNLDSWFPQFDIMSVLQATFNRSGIQLASGQAVIVSGRPFYVALANIINGTHPRVIQNYFAISHAVSYLHGLTERLRDMRFELDKEAQGVRTKHPTWFHCLQEIAFYMWQGLGKEFVKRRLLLSNESEILDYMNEMVDSIKSEFSDIFVQTDWMINTTKLAAQDKLAKMGRQVGYPKDNFEESDINYLYRNITFTKDNFFVNRQAMIRFYRTSNLEKLTEKVNNSRWKTRLIDANAFYETSLNHIVIPLGIMTPIFFSDNYPNSLNYGGIASIIGHEMVHGFDESGSFFDGDGSYNNWWQTKDRKEFDKRLQCVSDQYSNFVHPQVNLSLRGDRNLGEAVADLVGLQLAFRAFKKKYEASPKRELPLPGLGLTPLQQYFLSYAQRFCEIHTDEWLTDFILYQYHPPGRFRIIGVFQNDQAFAEVFSCPQESPMNPIDKCVVW